VDQQDDSNRQRQLEVKGRPTNLVPAFTIESGKQPAGVPGLCVRFVGKPAPP